MLQETACRELNAEQWKSSLAPQFLWQVIERHFFESKVHFRAYVSLFRLVIFGVMAGIT